MSGLNPLAIATQQSPIVEANRLKAELNGAGIKFIDLAQAAPNFPPAPELLEHMRQLLLDPTLLYGYGSAMGLDELRDAIAADMRKIYATSEIRRENVLVTCGCNEAYCAAINVIAQPGDEVLLQLPFYFNHDMWLKLSGLNPLYLPYSEGELGVDEAGKRVEAALTPSTRALVVVTPDNPTGRECSPELLERYRDLARERGILLFVDETYRSFRSRLDRPPHSLFGERDWGESVVHLYSFSKAYSLAGWRVGALVASGELLEQAVKSADCMTVCTSLIGQRAVLFAIENLEDWREQKRLEKQRILQRFRELMAAKPGGYELISSGAFFAFVRHPHKIDAAQVVRRLAFGHGLVCIPGTAHGQDMDSWLRLSVANAELDQLPQIVEILATDGASSP